MKRIVLAVGAVSLSTAIASASPSRLPAPVTLQGVGGVYPGLGIREVARRWGVRLEPDTTFGSPCQTASVRVRSLDGYALFEHRRFGSVFFRRGAVTGRGVRIGSTRAQLERAYPRGLTSRPNAYTPRARDYFFRRARKPRWELRFDVSPGGRVTVIAFGNATVRYSEGCA